jgi:selenocysteine lyase/cysteine desulfurase
MATVVEVRLAEDGGIDLADLERLLQLPAYQGRMRMGSFSAASNVTGMISPVHEIAKLLHRYDALAFFDYAASAPSVEINMRVMHHWMRYSSRPISLWVDQVPAVYWYLTSAATIPNYRPV